METEKSKLQKAILGIFGVILTPIILCLFIIDRFVMVFLIMSDAPTIKDFFSDIEYIMISALRSLVIFTFIFIVKWIWF
jgi:hypothetical protein